MTKSNQSSLDIADHLSRGEYDWCPEAETRLREQHDKLRLQQAEIEALKSELDRAVELYTDKAIENEALEKELTEAGGMIGVLREQLQEEIQTRAILRKAQEK